MNSKVLSVATLAGSKSVKRTLTIYWQMWSNKLPTAIHNNKRIPFKDLHLAREFAKENGYSGIKLIPTAVP